MKQLDLFDCYCEETKIPDFETWYSENSHERRQFGERPYSRKKAKDVYEDLIKIKFFNKGGK
tara:strand:+ start:222 stop:407 length:186 start_codon:yes stop_codon:yes gene_type:complete